MFISIKINSYSKNYFCNLKTNNSVKKKVNKKKI